MIKVLKKQKKTTVELRRQQVCRLEPRPHTSGLAHHLQYPPGEAPQPNHPHANKLHVLAPLSRQQPWLV